MRVWHWSHRAADSCDAWSEGETEWHAETKRSVGDEIEVLVRRATWTEDDGITETFRHRADACIEVGEWRRYIECQHSPISVGMVRERERFYSDLFWIFNLETPYEKERLVIQPSTYSHFWRWKHPRVSVLSVSRVCFWDVGLPMVFMPHSCKIGRYSGVWGYGRFWEREELKRLIRASPGWRTHWSSGYGGPDGYDPLLDPEAWKKANP